MLKRKAELSFQRTAEKCLHVPLIMTDHALLLLINLMIIMLQSGKMDKNAGRTKLDQIRSLILHSEKVLKMSFTQLVSSTSPIGILMPKRRTRVSMMVRDQAHLMHVLLLVQSLASVVVAILKFTFGKETISKQQSSITEKDSSEPFNGLTASFTLVVKMVALR